MYLSYCGIISVSRHCDDLLSIDNTYFEHLAHEFYLKALCLNTANPSDTEAPFLNLKLSISNYIITVNIYSK